MDMSLTLPNLPFEILLNIVDALGGPSHPTSEALLRLRLTNPRVSATIDKWCDSYAVQEVIWKLSDGVVLGLFCETSLNLVNIYKRIAIDLYTLQ